MKRLAYFLLLLVAGTIGLAAVRHEKSIPIATLSQKTTDEYKKINERFPTADYDDKQDLADAERNAKRKAKQKRDNDTDLVASHVKPGWTKPHCFSNHLLLSRRYLSRRVK